MTLEQEMAQRIIELENENRDLTEHLRIADETNGELNRFIRNLREQRDRLEKESVEWQRISSEWEKLCKGYQKSLDDSIKEQIASMKGGK